MTEIQPGDLLFYLVSGSATDCLIAWRTGGPVIHVGVAVAHGNVIEATSQAGVTLRPYDARPAALLCPTSRLLTPDGLASGLDFLYRAVRARAGYSYWDCFDAAVPRFLLPRLRWTPTVVSPHAFDCSHLASAFLWHAGGRVAWALGPHLERVSPNALARACGALPLVGVAVPAAPVAAVVDGHHPRPI